MYMFVRQCVAVPGAQLRLSAGYEAMCAFGAARSTEGVSSLRSTYRIRPAQTRTREPRSQVLS